MPIPPPLLMPPEWSPHAATWLAWPHNRTDWPGKMAVIPWVYGEIIRALVPGERVRVLVNDDRQAQRIRSLLKKVHADSAAVDVLPFPTNRGWTRDYGPWFVRQNKQPTIVDFTFNAWARYPQWQSDNAVAAHAAERFAMPRIVPTHKDRTVVLEGGAIDVNGAGSLLTTEECLLSPDRQVRNPGFQRSDYEAVFAKYLGMQHTIWLGDGIVGDDTHGHVDDLARFVSPDTIVLARETNPHDANYRALTENKERLEAARLADGSRPHVVALPMPAPLYHAGQRLPASYANFYIANAAVLAPTFNDPRDREALGILSDLFPDRTVMGIHAVDLVLGLGALHCLTQQEPAV